MGTKEVIELEDCWHLKEGVVRGCWESIAYKDRKWLGM